MNKYTGRDSFAFLPLRGTGKNYGSNQFLNWLQQYAPGILRFDFSSPFSPGWCKKTRYQMVSGLFGTPEGTRTPNPRNRNPMLYPLSHRCMPCNLVIIARFSRFVKGKAKFLSAGFLQIPPQVPGSCYAHNILAFPFCP